MREFRLSSEGGEFISTLKLEKTVLDAFVLLFVFPKSSTGKVQVWLRFSVYQTSQYTSERYTSRQLPPFCCLK